MTRRGCVRCGASDHPSKRCPLRAHSSGRREGLGPCESCGQVRLGEYDDDGSLYCVRCWIEYENTPAPEASLPILAHRDEIIRTCNGHSSFLLLGETGSGKSTQLAKLIAFDSDRRVACSEPRVLAALTLARRVEEELGDHGSQVGCATTAAAFCNLPPAKRICFTTHRVLLMAVASDSELKAFDCVILDETHERSVEADLLLGVLRKVCEIRRDFRLVLASATLGDAVSSISAYLGGCPVIRVAGRQHSVSVVHLDNDIVESSACAITVHATRDVLKRHAEGSVLVFLPSTADIEHACKLLAGARLQVLALHSKLTSDEQALVFSPLPAQFHRRVILATNIAETAVTVPGVRVVVDSGLERTRVWSDRGSSKLVTALITRSSAAQRTGRAGREGPGFCYRLYSKAQLDAAPHSAAPEILRVDLGSAVLRTKALGIRDLRDFRLLDPPKADEWSAGEEQLRLLGALDEEHLGLTALGRSMSQLSIEPRLASLALRGPHPTAMCALVTTAALMTVAGRVFFRAGSDEQKEAADRNKLAFSTADGDVMTMLEVYRQHNQVRSDLRAANRWCAQNFVNAKSMRGVKETISDMEKVFGRLTKRGFDVEECSTLVRQGLLFAFFQNLCVYTGHPQEGYMLLRDRDARVQIHPSSVLAHDENPPRWLVFADRLTTSKDYITTCTVVDHAWLLQVLNPPQLQWLRLGNTSEEHLAAIVKLDAAILERTAVRRGLSPLIVESLRSGLQEVQQSILIQYGPCHISVQHRNGRRLQLWAAPAYVDIALAALDEKLRLAEQEFFDEVAQRASSKAPSVRYIVANGMRVLSLLEPLENCTLELRCCSEDFANAPAPTRGMMEVMLSEAGIEGWLKPQQRPRGPASPSKGGRAPSPWLSIGLLTLRNPADASSAVRCSPLLLRRTGEEVIPIKLHPVMMEADTSRSPGSGLPRIVRGPSATITWCRRPSRGCAFVACVENLSHFVAAACDAMRMNGVMLSVSRSRNKPDKEVFVRGLPPDVDGDLLMQALKQRISEEVQAAAANRLPELRERLAMMQDRLAALSDARDQPDVGYLMWQGGLTLAERHELGLGDPREVVQQQVQKSIESTLRDIQGYEVGPDAVLTVGLQRMPPPANESTSSIALQLKSRIRACGLEEHTYKLEVIVPKQKDFDYRARLQFEANAGLQPAVAAMQSLHGALLEGAPQGSTLVVRPRFSSTVRCLKKVYECVSAQVNAFIRVVQPPGRDAMPRFNTFADESGSGFVTIHIIAASPSQLSMARAGIAQPVDGFDLPLNDAPASIVSVFFNRQGKSLLDEVMGKVGVYIFVDWRSQSLRVWGSEEARAAAQKCIDEHVTRLTLSTSEIELQGRGVVRAFIQSHGPKLEQWAAQIGADGVNIDLRRAVLSVTGTDAAVSRAQDVVDRLVMEHVQSNGLSEEDCGICLCSVDDAHYVRLICGHAHCRACLLQQIMSACNVEGKLPVACVTCDAPMALADLRGLTSHAQMMQLQEKAFVQSVRESCGKYQFCSTTGCGGVFRTVPAGSTSTLVSVPENTFSCSECSQLTCRACFRQSHDGYTCEEANAPVDQVSVLAIKRKIIEEVLTLKCPRADCRQAYNEFEGCCALTCHRCDAKFCGWCLQDCGSDAHGHVSSCPEKPKGNIDALFPEPKSEFKRHWEKRRERLVKLELAKHPLQVQSDVIKSLTKELADLGVSLPDPVQASASSSSDAALSSSEQSAERSECVVA